MIRPSCFACVLILTGCNGSWRVERGAPPSDDLVASFQKILSSAPRAESIRATHELLSSRPHRAGTEGDRRTINHLATMFREMGLETEVHEFHPWLARPIAGEVSIIAPDELPLSVQERPIVSDPYTHDPELTIGWNAYSGSGSVTGEIVYANFGTREDFQKLAELGVDVTGKIVLARYGGNFRGFKAKYAEAAGAAGLLIYSDPAQAGGIDFEKLAYPDGGWANETYIQRGSLLTLPYPGDPLTPFEPATENGPRLDPSDLALPTIPVQPIGWGAAGEILTRMTGPNVPEGWAGEIPTEYHLTGGAELRVAMRVEQERLILPTANVLGVIRGATHPEQMVIVGCHHDAWTFGAGDPNAGSIVLMEAARCFAEALKHGLRPARTIIFANWGAEEYGVMGSTEWCEANREKLLENGIAYINLDMAAMGPNFGASAAPMLKAVIAEAAKSVPQAGGEDGQTVHDAWTARSETQSPDALPNFGNLGGGSDHMGFYCHLGIPSCGMSGGGSPGTSYHSNYENLAWYRKIVGEDYDAAIMLTGVVCGVVNRLANAAVLPLDPAQYTADTVGHLLRMETSAAANGLDVDFSAIEEAIGALNEAAALRPLFIAASHTSTEPAARERIEAYNRILLQLEREWLHGPGLKDRPWFRNLYAANDPYSGYAAWMLPALRQAVEDGDPAQIEAAKQLYIDVFTRMRERLLMVETPEE